MVRKTLSFIKRVTQSFYRSICDIIRGIIRYAEAIIVLSLSSIGLSVLLSEVPFYITLPLWIETPMVIPVIAVLLIIGLVKLMELRRRPHLSHAVA